jgi:hypothetical protein
VVLAKGHHALALRRGLAEAPEVLVWRFGHTRGHAVTIAQCELVGPRALPSGSGADGRPRWWRIARAAVGGVAGAAAGAIVGFIVTGASTDGYGALVPLVLGAIAIPVGAVLGALGGPAVAGALGGHWVAADVE